MRRRPLFPVAALLVATTFTALLAGTPCQALIIPVTNTNTSGAGSLAQAIATANLTPAPDEIDFNILSLGTVTIDGPFPAITQPLLLDGYSQGNSSENTAEVGTDAVLRVQLDGKSLEESQALLQVDADDTTIRGVAIVNVAAKRIGIRIGADVVDAVVEGCFVGVTANGTTDAGGGIGILNQGTTTVIGGSSDLGARNLISGNDATGIDERGISTVIANNLIGTNAAATGLLPNGTGIRVNGAAATGTLIGGDDSVSPNLIAGNEEDGVQVAGTTGGNVQIRDNRFDDNGDLAIDLNGDGVTPNDDTDSDSGPNHLQNYPVITFARHHLTTLTVEGYLEAPGNNYRLEFYLVRGDPDPSGFGEGYTLIGVQAPTSAGPVFHFRYELALDNPIAGTAHITATAENLSTEETSEFSRALEVTRGGEELVVLNANDDGPGSLRAAIAAANADDNPNTIVFDMDPVEPIRPLTTLAITQEVIIDGYTQAPSKPNTLEFGTNAQLEVEISGSQMTTGAPFLIDANRVVMRGLVIHHAKGIGIQYTTGEFGRIEGCFVGTDVTGMEDGSNGSHGIFTGATTLGIDIGGELPSQRNLVSGNNTHGMRITGDGAVIRGNIVGADATGLNPIPNDFNGISVEGHGVLVGSDEFNGPGQNVSAFNIATGITVSSVALGVEILGNSIHSNGGLGIELSVGGPGVTPNDEDDDDTGANNLQNFPKITAVFDGVAETTIDAILDVPAGVVDGEYTIRVYANETCDPSGHGEGQIFVGADDVAVSDDDETFSVTVPKDISDDFTVSLTATERSTGNTSELSKCAGFGVVPPLCGDASGDDEITAPDALTTLRTAVGTVECQLCVCDVNGNGEITTTDALFVLRTAVGQSVDLNCPPCP